MSIGYVYNCYGMFLNAFVVGNKKYKPQLQDLINFKRYFLFLYFKYYKIYNSNVKQI